MPAGVSWATRPRSVHIVGWLLALWYGLAAPVTAVVEFGSHVFSQRFDLPPARIYLTCAVQTACAAGVLRPPLAVQAAAVLSVTTLGAIGAHLRVGSPQTAVAAVGFTAVQLWYVWMCREHTGEPG